MQRQFTCCSATFNSSTLKVTCSLSSFFSKISHTEVTVLYYLSISNKFYRSLQAKDMRMCLCGCTWSGRLKIFLSTKGGPCRKSLGTTGLGLGLGGNIRESALNFFIRTVSVSILPVESNLGQNMFSYKMRNHLSVSSALPLLHTPHDRKLM